MLIFKGDVKHADFFSDGVKTSTVTRPTAVLSKPIPRPQVSRPRPDLSGLIMELHKRNSTCSLTLCDEHIISSTLIRHLVVYGNKHVILKADVFKQINTDMAEISKTCSVVELVARVHHLVVIHCTFALSVTEVVVEVMAPYVKMEDTVSS